MEIGKEMRKEGSEVAERWKGWGPHEDSVRREMKMQNKHFLFKTYPLTTLSTWVCRVHNNAVDDICALINERNVQNKQIEYRM